MITPKENIELIVRETWSEITKEYYKNSFIRFGFLKKSAVIDFDKNIIKIVIPKDESDSYFIQNALSELEQRMTKETGIVFKIKFIPCDY